MPPVHVARSLVVAEIRHRGHGHAKLRFHGTLPDRQLFRPGCRNGNELFSGWFHSTRVKLLELNAVAGGASLFRQAEISRPSAPSLRLPHPFRPVGTLRPVSCCTFRRLANRSRARFPLCPSKSDLLESLVEFVIDEQGFQAIEPIYRQALQALVTSYRPAYDDAAVPPPPTGSIFAASLIATTAGWVSLRSTEIA